MALSNFDNWRDRLDEMEGTMGGKPPAVASDPSASIKALKQGVMGIDPSLMRKAVPFINSMAVLDPMSKVKLIAHIMTQVGISPADLTKVKSRM